MGVVAGGTRLKLDHMQTAQASPSPVRLSIPIGLAGSECYREGWETPNHRQQVRTSLGCCGSGQILTSVLLLRYSNADYGQDSLIITSMAYSKSIF